MRFLLDLHHYDDNHENNSPSNLLPVCVPCHMTHHIGMAGIKRLGILSWIPEWPQEKVNSISILALASNHLDKYVDRYSDSINDNARKKINKLRSAMQNAAKIYRSFISRSEYLSSTISGDEAQLSDPVVLSNIMLAMSDEEYRNRASLLPVLSGIRLVPMRDGYEENERCGYKNMADAWAHALFRMATGIPSKSS
ncbi:MAG: HNH endonuclease [Methanobacteriota archaeon]|nr:MAG: HNH endonuclease [Euryarchaeota archaeon]